MIIRYLTQATVGYLLLRFTPGSNLNPKTIIIIISSIMILYISLEYLMAKMYSLKQNNTITSETSNVETHCSSCSPPKSNIEGFANTMPDNESNDDSMIADELGNSRNKMLANKYNLDADYKDPNNNPPLTTENRTSSDWDGYINKSQEQLEKERKEQMNRFLLDEQARTQHEADAINQKRLEMARNTKEFEKELQARMDPYNDPPTSYTTSKNKVIEQKIEDKVTMQHTDFNTLQVPDNYRANNDEFGYSFIKPEHWYPLPPNPPICVTDNRAAIYPAYTDGAPIDAKIWNNSRFSTPFMRINNEAMSQMYEGK